MKILIPGGLGYIGSHMVEFLKDRNHEVVILDNLSTGNEWASLGCEVILVDLLDRDELKKKLCKRKFDGVIHFAAKSIVSESVLNPDLYYENNFVGTKNLIDVMEINEIQNIIFSSSAAVYGNPISNKIDENHPTVPINPYGKTKLMVEKYLEEKTSEGKINATCLRYFNAAGASYSKKIGECREPETHLIPNIIRSGINKDLNFDIFGDNYDTPDGTCIRDYIHVFDLAKAHYLALKEMNQKSNFQIYNLGSGSGFSIMEIKNTCEQVLNINIPYKIKPRREGDPAILISNINKASKVLGWKPDNSEIKNIIETAYNFEKVKDSIIEANNGTDK